MSEAHEPAASAGRPIAARLPAHLAGWPKRRPPAAGVSIGGWVHRPLSLDAAELERQGAVDIPEFIVQCTLNGQHGAPRRLRGTRLAPLISQAEPAFAERTDFKRVAVVAEARDGYRALFSWAELFNTLVGDGVFLVFDCAQAPLGEATGPFALISLHDKISGPRFMRGLVAVDLHKIW